MTAILYPDQDAACALHEQVVERLYDLAKRGVRGGFYIHQLVAQVFIGPRPVGKEINHIDGDKYNNHYTNLEYVTRGEQLSLMGDD